MSGHPVRQESAHGQPQPTSPFLRACKACGASFAHLQPIQAGIWRGWRWYCSAECAPESAP